MGRINGFASFFVLWFGQLISALGSGLTSFGLGVWIYQTTHSATQFSMVALCAVLPGVVLAPFAGTWVDRYDRRKLLMLSDLLAGIGSLILALLLRQDALQVWHIYVIACLGAAATCVHWPAIAASVTMLVPKAQYARANGMLQLMEAITTIAAPALAGVLLMKVGLWGLVVIDFASFLVAVGSTLLIRIPRPKTSEEGERARGSIWKEAAFGWHYIVARKGLLGMVLFFMLVNYAGPMSMVLLTPLVLSLYKPTVLGFVETIAGVGMLLGTAVVTAWGGPKRRVDAIPLFGFFSFLGCSLLALRPSPGLFAASIFLSIVSVPILNASSQAIWQSKVPADLQGRVFAIRRMIATVMAPLAMGTAGIMADRVFVPALRPGGVLEGWLSPIFGNGTDAGIRLMFVISGVVLIAVAVGFYLLPAIRNLERDLPDSDHPAEPTLEVELAPAG